jgi:SAM-dependent methyltransferase
MSPASSISVDRWRQAQRAEGEYWSGISVWAPEVLRLLGEKLSFAAWIAERMDASPPAGDWAEIGIGPMGVGTIHFLDDTGDRRLLGIEPLPLIPMDRLALPPTPLAVIRACRAARYQHLQARGEASGLAAGSCSLVACYNVLDHVQDPAGVLAEARRLVRPGGWLALGCDTSSLLGTARVNLYVRRRYPDSIMVRAHPFRFTVRSLVALVRDAGFEVATDDRPGGRIAPLIGRGHRLLLLARARA